MNRKIFRSVLFSTLAALILSLVAVIFISYNTISNEEHNRIQNAGLVFLDAYNQHGIDSFKSLHLENYRLTLINNQGVVLFDSLKDEISENHLNREEIQEALVTGYGESARFSNTLKKRTFYSAMKTADGNILRVAISTETILNYVLQLSGYLVAIFLIVAIICLFTSFKISQSILQPLYDIDLNGPLSQVKTYPEIMPFLYEIDKRQRALDAQNETLRNKNEEFLTITKSMSEGLVLLNAEGIILTINKTAKKIFNISDDVIGKSFLTLDRSEKARSFFFKDENASFKDLKANLKDQNSNPHEEQTLIDSLNVKDQSTIKNRGDKKSCEITKDGRDYQLRFNKIRFNGKIAGYALLIIDITDTKRAEELRQEFTANVSHELKTPLTSISGYSELIMRDQVDKDHIKEFSSQIYSEAKRLYQLIEDIMAISRLDEEAEVEFSEIDVASIAKDVLDSISNPIVRIENKGKLLIRGNSTLIFEAIYNLVDNAIKYNRDSNEIVIRIDDTSFEVEDHGIGLSPYDKERVFDRFYRVDKSRNRQTGGTGLGLSIVKSVAERHGAKIEINSTLGVGTTIKLVFPSK